MYLTFYILIFRCSYISKDISKETLIHHTKSLETMECEPVDPLENDMNLITKEGDSGTCYIEDIKPLDIPNKRIFSMPDSINELLTFDSKRIKYYHQDRIHFKSSDLANDFSMPTPKNEKISPDNRSEFIRVKDEMMDIVRIETHSCKMWKKVLVAMKTIMDNLNHIYPMGGFNFDETVDFKDFKKMKELHYQFKKEIQVISFLNMTISKPNEYIFIDDNNEWKINILLDYFDDSNYLTTLSKFLKSIVRANSMEYLILNLVVEIKNNKTKITELKSLVLLVFHCYPRNTQDKNSESNVKLKILIAKSTLFLKLINSDIPEGYKVSKQVYKMRINKLLIKTIGLFLVGGRTRPLQNKIKKYRKEIATAEREFNVEKTSLDANNLLFINYVAGKGREIVQTYVIPNIKLRRNPGFEAEFKKMGYSYLIKSINLLYTLGDILLDNWDEVKENKQW